MVIIAPSGSSTGSGASSSAPADELVTGEAVALAVHPVGFLLRALSGFIDLLVSVGVLLGLVWLVATLGAHADQAALRAMILVCVVLALVVLPIAVEVLSHGRSLGRLAVGARIVRDDGGAAGIRHAFIRALTGVAEIYATLGGIAVIVALLNPRSKRLGDLLAGSYAQRERAPRLPPLVIAVPPQLAAWSELADVAALPDPLARRISSFLAQQGQLTDASRWSLAALLAGETAPYVHPLPQVDAVTFLTGVSAVRRARERRALEAEAHRLAALTPTLARRPNGFPER